MKILISAAEASSDAHGAQLIRSLREEDPEVQLFGVGGPRMQKEGFRRIVDARDLLAMGLSEVISRLPRILRSLSRVTQSALTERPDAVVLIDYPEFHFKLAKRLSRLGVPLVYFIPPKVWVWRSHRLEFLKRHFKLILGILPFEDKMYRQAGVPFQYVGNPLADELPLSLTRAEARRGLGLSETERVVVLMPGSRPGELRNHFEVFLDAADAAARGIGQRWTALVPLSDMTDLGPIRARLERWQSRSSDCALEVRLTQGDSAACLVAADAGLVKSGTSTLEAGLLGCPHAVVYKPNRLTAWAFKYLVRYKGPVGLVNLVGGWKAGDASFFSEILMERVTVDELRGELITLMNDPSRRDSLLSATSELRLKVLGEDRIGPSKNAARAILAVARREESSGGELDR